MKENFTSSSWSERVVVVVGVLGVVVVEVVFGLVFLFISLKYVIHRFEVVFDSYCEDVV
jgi:hypothetical protein